MTDLLAPTSDWVRKPLDLVNGSITVRRRELTMCYAFVGKAS